LVAELLSTCRDVVIFDRAIPGKTISGVQYVAGDCGNIDHLAKAIEGCQEIVYLVYATQPKTSFEDPLLDLQANVPVAVDLLQHLVGSSSLQRFVFVSSGGTVYGPVEHCPISENAENHPISPYGITKLTIEKYAMMYWRVHGVPVQIVRPGNPYGPGQRPFSGQGFIATAIGSVLQGRQVPIFGGGKTVRDYLYIDDLAKGIVSVMDKGRVGEIYNIGSGVGLSNMQVLECLRRVAERRGYAFALENFPARGFDVPENVLDIKKLSSQTGWLPAITFTDGLERTWDAIEQELRKH
jgi:UDP-glucose 4-epimerase